MAHTVTIGLLKSDSSFRILLLIYKPLRDDVALDVASHFGPSDAKDLSDGIKQFIDLNENHNGHVDIGDFPALNGARDSVFGFVSNSDDSTVDFFTTLLWVKNAMVASSSLVLDLSF